MIQFLKNFLILFIIFILTSNVAKAAGANSENFDGLTAQIVSNIDSLDFDGATSWSFIQNYAAQVTIAGENNGGSFTNGLSNDYSGDQVLFLNYNGLTNVDSFAFHPTDYTNFKLNSFQLGNNLVGYSLSVTVSVYLNNVLVGSATLDLNTSSSSNGITYTYLGDSDGGSARPYGTLTFDSTYQYVNEIRLKYSSMAAPLIDNILVSPAIPTISGNAGVAGAILSYTDGTAKTDTAGADGGYSFSVSHNWSGTVTPSKTDYSFTPANKAYSSVTSNQTGQNYTVTLYSPVLANIEGTALSYAKGGAATAITSAITVSDANDANMDSACVKITTNYQNGQDVLSFTNQNGITGNWNASAGTMSLNGTSSKANYQIALRSVKYNNTSQSPSTLTRTVSFYVNDGTVNSDTLTRSITLTSGNSPPVLSNISLPPLNYTEGDTLQIISTLTLSDADNENMKSAVVQITGNYQSGEDILLFSNQNGITGKWDAASGRMLLSGTAANYQYQDALRSVAYSNTSQNPSTEQRTISFTVSDGTASSLPETRKVNIIPVDNPPVISFKFRPISFNENETLTLPFSQLYPFISDPDNPDSTLIITFTYSGSHLSITEPTDTSVSIKPEKNWYGLDTVTVKVSDGTLSTSASFAVDVIFVNHPPVFTSLPDSLIVKGGDTTNVNIFNLVSDVETPDDSLAYNFTVGSDSLLYVFNAAKGILSLSSMNGYAGTTDITIRVTDKNGGVTDTSITVDVVGSVTGIESFSGMVPKSYEVYQNYPNPFNPTTVIRYGLPKESNVVIKIYNILGQEVQTLFSGIERAGYHEEMFDASRLSSGVYIYSVVAESTGGSGRYSIVKKMILMK